MTKSIVIDPSNVDKAKPVDRSKLFDLAEGLPDEPSILPILDRDLKTFGYAGSTNVTLLAYLATYSRVLERPCHLLIKGPSGCGKSFAMEAALRYVPPTAYKFRSGMSDMALAYSGWDLRHMYLVIGEAAGLADGRGRAFLRQLMSDGEISYSTVQQGKEGHQGCDLPKVQGPCGVIMTTTAQLLHPEDETRFLSFQMDQSPERIRTTLLSQARNEIRRPTSKQLSRWHALHDFCFTGTRSVHIPYLEQLAEALPVGDHRVFRDFQQIQSLIKGHTLLHQQRRERDREKTIASLDDYTAVYALVNEPLSQGLRATVAPNILDVVTAVKKWFDENHEEGKTRGVNQSEIAQRMGRNPSVVSRNIRAAIALGYVRNLASMGRGNEAVLEMGDVQMPSGRVLPTPAELAAAIVKSGKSARSEADGYIAFFRAQSELPPTH